MNITIKEFAIRAKKMPKQLSKCLEEFCSAKACGGNIAHWRGRKQITKSDNRPHHSRDDFQSFTMEFGKKYRNDCVLSHTCEHSVETFINRDERKKQEGGSGRPVLQMELKTYLSKC